MKVRHTCSYDIHTPLVTLEAFADMLTKNTFSWLFLFQSSNPLASVLARRTLAKKYKVLLILKVLNGAVSHKTTSGFHPSMVSASAGLKVKD